MNTKDRIIEAADELFYSGSIRETSVDRIAERAGVTKKTLYYHFRSKDDLVAAYLEARDRPTRERYLAWAGTSGPMADRVVRMFTALSEHARREDWRGCGFLRAAVELADSQGHPALEVARRHKAGFEAWLAEELEQDGYGSAHELARLLMILLDGAIARMLVNRDPAYAMEAGQAARSLLLSRNDSMSAMYTD
ncbi:TetR/AcrR family transcriptional regulator [Nisaea sediminum]|uniref:TetR/AcrR family transcriptional regulator n=1 Tax=Nisaea sediminum TaxID=2775867 RepID=UPI00186934AC|nr:TetR/AcrR family transcriptional regulator [Nisaea sediminum]